MTTVGWDPGMFSASASSPGAPGSPNYWASPGGVGAKKWTVAIACEDAESAFAGDPQSLPILTAGGIANLTYATDGGDGHKVWHFYLDVYNQSLPVDTFSWFAILDHVVLAGGPLPEAGLMHQTFWVNYNDFCPQGAARLIAYFAGYWAGQSWVIEVNLVETGWGDTDPAVDITYYNPALNYVVVKGSAIGLGVTKLVSTQVTIPWGSILRTLAWRGYIDPPDYTWRWTTANASSIAVGVAAEIHNFTTNLSAVADWYVWGQTLDSNYSNDQLTIDDSTTSGYIPLVGR